MSKTKPDNYYAELSGIQTRARKKGKYDPVYDIYDKNMRRVCGQTWHPYKYEVPAGGCVVLVLYDEEEEQLIFKKDK